VLTVPVATNHQHRGDWPDYERAVGTFDRERRLLELLRTPGMSSARLVQAFLEEPLYRASFASGLGTLYTAVYFPARGRAEYRWPDHMTTQSFECFAEQRHTQRYAEANAPDEEPKAKESL
jgi:predicted choloylglycine hydrolase